MLFSSAGDCFSMGNGAIPACKSLSENFRILLNAQCVFTRFAKLGPVELKCKTVLWEDLNYLQRFQSFLQTAGYREGGRRLWRRW